MAHREGIKAKAGLKKDRLQHAYQAQAVIGELLHISLQLVSLQQQLEQMLNVIFSLPWLQVQYKGAVFLVEDEPETLVLIAQRNLPAPLLQRCAKVPFGQCLCGRAASARKPVYADCIDHRHETRFPGITPHGHICLPLIVEGNLLGVLGLYLDEGYRIDSHEKEFLNAVADVLAGVIKRKHIEKSIQQIGKQYRELLEAAPDAIVVADGEGKIALVNEQTEQLFGYKRKELLGKHIECLIPEQYRARHLVQRATYTAQPTVRAMSDRKRLFGQRKDGTVFPLDISLSPLKTESGLLITAIIRDITERQQVERRLSRLASFPEDNPNPVIELDDTGQVSYMNPAANDFFPDLSQKNGAHPMLIDIGAVVESLKQKGRNSILRNVEVGGKVYEQNIHCLPELGIVRIYAWDITSVRDMTHELKRQASLDALTGLINRHEFELRLNQALVNARNENKEHAFLYLDLDQFKIVNDTCGHIAGDELLKQLSILLKGKVRETDTLARLGGDEFGLLLDNCPLTKVEELGEMLRDAVADFRFVWEGKTFDLGVSVGIAQITAASTNVTELQKAADLACYVAKEQGRNRVHVYRPDDAVQARHSDQMQWVPRLRQALEENRFHLYYQTIVPTYNGLSAGEHWEMLLRLVDEQGKIVSPMTFIPAAERYNLMTVIDRWVVSKALELLQTQATHVTLCAINVSGQSLCDKKFTNFVIQQIDESGIDPGRLCFEVTETAAIANLSHAIRFISILRGMGCLFALDDFGSGLSSFAYLKNFTVDYLKIDGRFVKDMLDDEIDCAMVQAINNIGHAMKICTIAEFVENDAILAKLKEIGVDYAQGFGISKPMPVV